MARLLLTGFQDAYTNMAIDEALAKTAAKTGKTTVRLYGWKPPAVSIGYFQSLREEVDASACRAAGVDIVRRLTGGGAVYHDAEVTYSVTAPLSAPWMPRDIRESYRVLCQGVVAGLARLGVQASFVPLNDLVAGGKKISGNAQTRRFGAVLQHGTVLLEVDVEKMFSLLKVPSEKMRGKLVQDVKQRVTSVVQQTGKQVSFQQAVEALARGFQEALGEPLEQEALTPEEKKLAARARETRFTRPSWTAMR